MKYDLKIGWLYPELMNIYGDRGNITILEKRCQWRGIKTEILRLDLGFSEAKLRECNLLIMGGAQDKQQEAVAKDLFEKKKILKKMIDEGIPGLYICGAYQFLGKYYQQANGEKIMGLGVFDLFTKNPGENHPRLIGNLALESGALNYRLLGFENHGGRTYLGKNIEPFGKVINGYGNNAEDKTEGAHYKNSFGTYLHGPILPKNPALADYLIKISLEIKYKEKITLKKLDDALEEKARIVIAKRLSIAI